MIKLYGVAPSCTFRCLWLLEELGLKYERELIHWDDAETQRSKYLELNPNGRIPCLVDGDLVLFESLAINLYLVRRYAGSLAPTTIKDEGRVLQWSFWAANEIESPLTDLAIERASKPEAEWNQSVIDEAEVDLTGPISILNNVLTDSAYLLGESFSIADLNVAAVIFPGVLNGYDLTSFPNVSSWYGRCSGRPALQLINEWAQAELRPRQ